MYRLFFEISRIFCTQVSLGISVRQSGTKINIAASVKCPRRMDTWPSNTASEKNRKGKAKATFLPCPLLQGGALTSATLREDEQGRFEWVTAQGRASGTSERCSCSNSTDTMRIGRKLVCGEETVLAFPNTRLPQPHQRTTSLSQRAEHGVCILHGVLFHDLPYTI
jgi:hypothetical protein